MSSAKPSDRGPKASKARHNDVKVIQDSGHATQAGESTAVTSVLKAVVVLVLTAAYSPISLLTLSPVYGSVPSATYHRQGMMAAALLGWLGKGQVAKLLSKNMMRFIPVLAFAIPTIQFFLFQQSTRLGAVYGPLATEVLTFFPLVLLSMSTAAIMLEQVDLHRFGSLVRDHGSFIGSYLLFSTSEKVTTFFIPRYIGSHVFFSRIGLQFATATLYAVSIPSKLLLFAIPSVLFSGVYNYHVPLPHTTALLNSTLQAENYVLLHRQESLTGYLSVFENTKDHFRVMRCDHSLLGGEWTHLENRKFPKVRESIYSVFTTLEAVRLIEKDTGGRRQADSESSALVIGLGIGTTPTALITHGIDTTVVEIDPVVAQLAAKYFSVPDNFKPVIQDAVTFVGDAVTAGNVKYDYIVHDVFTGGIEPVSLFTVEFIQGLSSLLEDDGAVAINYAGDLSLPPAGIIVRTILSVFPSCRIFRDGEPLNPTDPSKGDFTNMVIFCKKTASPPLKILKPTEADYLGTRSREMFLYPQNEIDPALFEKGLDTKQDILSDGDTTELRVWQSHGAVGHWEIMRSVLPASVWEKW
ncbi:hypothetical protein AJ80_08256 [Polytolypa hystricis UAMH7299]|uniref:PABS domain-containing protein n=1 Tax=Polytolypa hystricis (strain UAMH7299) TaxID=1447883 RepID=A0A2B7X2R9_POLH7|nr:hypothetical protein AJ80_08256 [Polytolypa hystricis UAMH7299]